MIKTPYIKVLLLIFALPVAANANFLLGIAEVLGLEVARRPADDLSEAVGGESGNLGLQRPVTTRTTNRRHFSGELRLYRTSNMFKSEQDELVDKSPFLSWGAL